VNGNPVEDLANEAVFKTHSKGFIGLQIHGLSEREINQPIHAGSGVTPGQPLVIKGKRGQSPFFESDSGQMGTGPIF
jgi:hypothetical protein